MKNNGIIERITRTENDLDDADAELFALQLLLPSALYLILKAFPTGLPILLPTNLFQRTMACSLGDNL